MSVSTVKSPVLNDSQTLEEVVNCLTEHIPIQAQVVVHSNDKLKSVVQYQSYALS